MSRSSGAATLAACAFLFACTSDKVVGRYRRATCKTIALVQPGTPGFPDDVLPQANPAGACALVLPVASASAFSIATPQPPAGPAGPPKPDAPPASVDLTVFHRTLVVSVRKDGGFNPADRLEATDVTIRLGNARFDSWDTLATAYTMINAGTVQLSQARGSTQSATLSPPPASPIGGGLSLGASESDTRAEGFTAQNQAETLTASVLDDGAELRIHRQGGYGVDLTGNTVVKADLTYTGAPEGGGEARNAVSAYLFSVASYVDAKGLALPAGKLRLDMVGVSTLPPNTDIRAEVFLTYTMRHVLSGDDTYEERDDAVEERTVGPVRSFVTLVPAREASVLGYGLVIREGKRSLRHIEAALPGREPVALCFRSGAEAEALLAHLRTDAARPLRLANAALGVVRPEMNPDHPPLVSLTDSQLASASTSASCF